MRRARKIVTVATLLGGLVAVQASAQAQQGATGAGSVGAADITVEGMTAHSDPIAPCAVDTTPSNRTDPITVGTKTKYGLGETTCTRNADGTASVKVTGQRFETSVLEQFGGPVIKARTFGAGCNTTANGSNGSMELGTVTGITVPQSIPPNHVVTIPGATPDAPPMAEVVLNELVVPTPADGSLTTNALHIKLFPQGGPASGDILVGSASCSPYGR
ncbi:choice-of-anchor P family protein [Amycolatopsis endophytica]|uniref:Secreted protein n=1 Tax=Amycolatopsis endophytica TaxID=860233 RepID=A0A853AWU5_9PSEU|nr:choice-of-anchor P family protein [Amycolatopsis endophytica]NYI87109.1 hypothetical protein [Amycolatopsis endophytica]